MRRYHTATEEDEELESILAMVDRSRSLDLAHACRLAACQRPRDVAAVDMVPVMVNERRARGDNLIFFHARACGRAGVQARADGCTRLREAGATRTFVLVPQLLTLAEVARRTSAAQRVHAWLVWERGTVGMRGGTAKVQPRYSQGTAKLLYS